ncbi:non-ribosomal peptide synthetase [Caballeronia humi]|uniref:Non-ribosomal peptide synthetase n=1 Tax=Caballeronia humi TaxID=326474 RepID=A0A158IT53_9BURK|nr:non-ribosomal peptide synthetase [Caballeronia humi]SAL59842.1 non-ribosomal peptide synthetase [Caballeronia humi]
MSESEEFFTDTTVTAQFAQRAGRHPLARAVTCGAQTITYEDLDTQSDRWAQTLRLAGAGPEVRVGLLMYRSVEAIIAIVAIAKTGAVCVPLECAHPDDRHRATLREANCRILVTAAGIPALPGDWSVVDVEALRAAVDIEEAASAPIGREALPQNLLYVIHTSGSSGRPKGVQVTHANIVSLTMAARALEPFGVGDVWSQIHSLAFDLSVWEIWGCLLTGGELVIVATDIVRSPAQCLDVLRRSGVSVLSVTPTVLGEVLIHSIKALVTLQLRMLTVGGEHLPSHIALPIARDGLPIWNFYGPTECSVWATAGRLDPAQLPGAGQISIGLPLRNSEVHVLDEQFDALPFGIEGELYIGGDCVTRGYLNRPALTAERFIPDPFGKIPGSRLYRTGDRARRDNRGALHILGRVDQQIKLHGYRIEPAEIEAVLMHHVDLATAVVQLREDALGKYLAAFVVPEENRELDIAGLREHLRTRVPNYMVPRVIVPLPALPTTTNGKVDFDALTIPTFDRLGTTTPYFAPRTPEEASLAATWREILQVPSIGIADNFFELGGDSLKAIRVAARAATALCALTAADVLRHPTIAGLAEHARQVRAIPAPSVADSRPVDKTRSDPVGSKNVETHAGGGSFALTPLQKGLLFHAIANPEDSEYFQQVICEIHGELDADIFEASWNTLLGRHEALRAAFVWRDLDEPVQRFLPTVQIQLHRHDHLGLSSDIAERRRAALIEADRADGFNLEVAPLMRVHLIRESETRHWMVWSHHHLVLDGWSLPLALAEVFRGHARRLAGVHAPDEGPAASFSTYLHYLVTRDSRNDELFWRQELSGFSLPTPLPFARATGTKFAAHFRGTHSTVAAAVPDTTLHAIAAFCKAHRLTENILFCGAWALTLATYAGHYDVMFGLTTSGRSAPVPQVDEILGLLINTVPLRVRGEDDQLAFDWLAKLGSHVRDVIEREHASLIDIHQWSQIPGDMPLFHSNLVCESDFRERMQAVDGEYSRIGKMHILERTNFPLTLTVVSGAAMRFELGYRSDLVPDHAARRILCRFESVLSNVTRHGVRLRELVSPTNDELQVLRGWCGQIRPRRDRSSVLDLFRLQARKQPQACALRDKNRGLTFAELDRSSDAFARVLRARGVRAEVRVGLLIDKSVELVQALLGVLKAGGAYCILDPGQPAEHRAASIKAAAIGMLLTIQDLATDGPPIDEASGQAEVHDSQLAYIVFTSGSSGRPKPVGVSHASILSAYIAWREVFGLEGQCRNHLQMANPCFDVFTGDWVRALCSGGCLVLCERDVLLSPPDLLRLIDLHDIHIGEFVPAVLRSLVQDASERGVSCATPRFIVAGSDAWRNEEFESVRPVFPAARIMNSYGLSESTVDSTWYDGTFAKPDNGLTIGRRLSNTTVYVLDDSLQMRPIGATGELFIGGDGLARGYLMMPAMTAERFIPNPFEATPGARLYQTGDRVRFTADGDLEFLGRRDKQVKIRGHRIEPAEIELAMLSHRGVAAAVVQLREDSPDDPYLAAYVVAATGFAVDAAGLREHTRDRLPGYMVPQAFVVLDELPTTVNGKIDRSALPAPVFDRQTAPGDGMPRDELETVLASIWADVLDLVQVGIHDNFFDLGGHSLKATRVVSHVADLFGVEVSIRSVFEYPTVSGFAAELVAKHRHGDRLRKAAAVMLEVARLSDSDMQEGKSC